MLCKQLQRHTEIRNRDLRAPAGAVSSIFRFLSICVSVIQPYYCFTIPAIPRRSYWSLKQLKSEFAGNCIKIFPRQYQ